jgi:hypothetical protein
VVLWSVTAIASRPAAAAAAASASGAHEEWCGVAVVWICRSIVIATFISFEIKKIAQVRLSCKGENRESRNSAALS